MAEYCRSCAQFQKTNTNKVYPVPLITLPASHVPFERIAKDIVGPLPRSPAWHRFILVICDYTTRYPEIIPLRSAEARHVAEALALVGFFSRVGIPWEVLIDQVTNFMSQLMGEVYRMLGVKTIQRSVYHPQTDGLVERFNQTLKAMLMRTMEEEKD